MKKELPQLKSAENIYRIEERINQCFRETPFFKEYGLYSGKYILENDQIKILTKAVKLWEFDIKLKTIQANSLRELKEMSREYDCVTDKYIFLIEKIKTDNETRDFFKSAENDLYKTIETFVNSYNQIIDEVSDYEGSNIKDLSETKTYPNINILNENIEIIYNYKPDFIGKLIKTNRLIIDLGKINFIQDKLHYELKHFREWQKLAEFCKGKTKVKFKIGESPHYMPRHFADVSPKPTKIPFKLLKYNSKK